MQVAEEEEKQEKEGKKQGQAWRSGEISWPTNHDPLIQGLMGQTAAATSAEINGGECGVLIST